MATELTGNMARVRDALAVGDVVGYNDGPGINAEIAPGVSPKWYLVETVPGQERVAAAHLAARRFGIFVPDMRFEPKAVLDAKGNLLRIERGERLDRLRRMFVGYIFVFAWMDDRNFHRITAIPGVSGILRHADGKVVEFTDEQVANLRTLETILCPVELPADWRKPTRKKYGWRKERRIARDAAGEKTLSTVKGWINVGDQWISTIDALRIIDDHGENQSLARALGLSS